MIPKPTALGLTFRDLVIVEKGTEKFSFVGCFDDLEVDSFPSEPKQFWLVAPLARGWNRGKIKLMVSHLESQSLVSSKERQVYFQDRSRVVTFRWHLERIRFPAPGAYLFTLWVDEDLIAERTLHVYSS
jgi:hypothetical protein